MSKVMVGIDTQAEAFRNQRDEVAKGVIDLKGLHNIKMAHLLRSNTFTLVRASGSKGEEGEDGKVMDRLCQLIYSVRLYDRELIHAFTADLVTLQNDFLYEYPRIADDHRETTYGIKVILSHELARLSELRDQQVHRVLCETADKISHIVSLIRPDIQKLLCELIEQARNLDAALLDAIQGDSADKLRSARNHFEFEIEQL